MYLRILVSFALLLVLMTGCSNAMGQGNIHKVGMLVEHTVHDQVWGQKGYKGLLDIKDELKVDVYFKQHIQSKQSAQKAIEEFAQEGVNLIFGHGSSFGKYFDQLQSQYPDIQFVYFNGSIHGENITSLNFNAHAMGFFGGMVAAGMSQTDNVGIIAAYEWQPEIEGFYEGALYQNPDADVHIQYVNSWDNTSRAKMMFNQMKIDDVDTFYPAGDGFNVPLMKSIKESDLQAIGYVSDQSNFGDATVLTSTVQHVDKLYLLAAKQFNNGELPNDVLTFDFQDEAISLGDFSSTVPEGFKKKVKSAVEEYKETGKLPNK
ncbi:BMP family ABC transporter substrate-binding protein [Pontibacillus yanchengensis]|uniref:Transcriptional regulator n=1 Tax=Pontibacillus yanchengensis Y32 TaxID=1385514 RepID=A0A0A2TIY3_9BACI|nr:BMP family ABC transporter substrate-binding protein [Pontibacillus yanchengensis]KGP74368.1 transcriptional regulator [Pontibacillus yanchengensis Y32]